MEVYNLPTGEGKTEGEKNVDLQKDIDNSTGRTSKQRRHLKENDNKRTRVLKNLKVTVLILWTPNEERWLVKFNSQGAF